jgi:hypothetical protein
MYKGAPNNGLAIPDAVPSSSLTFGTSQKLHSALQNELAYITTLYNSTLSYLYILYFLYKLLAKGLLYIIFLKDFFICIIVLYLERN